MNATLTALSVSLRDLLNRENGQDLVEYSLVFTMIAFGCVSGMGFLATGLNTVFSSTGSLLTTSIS